MFAPFTENLSEYGFIVQDFWNNYGQKVVPDPFAQRTQARRAGTVPA